jgi:hypothetical protein
LSPIQLVVHDAEQCLALCRPRQLNSSRLTVVLGRTGRDAFHCVPDQFAGRQMGTQWNASLPTTRECARARANAIIMGAVEQALLPLGWRPRGRAALLFARL